MQVSVKGRVELSGMKFLPALVAALRQGGALIAPDGTKIDLSSFRPRVEHERNYSVVIPAKAERETYEVDPAPAWLPAPDAETE